MFLTNTDYNVEDFLQAIQFIPPQGMSVAYFITPNDINMPQGTGYQQQQNIEKMPDESQTYTMTPPQQKIDQAVTPAEFSHWQPGELGRRQPTPNVLPDITDPGEQELGCPFVKVLSESRLYGTDIQLLEDFHMFPKNTLFHCMPNKLSEAELKEPKGLKKFIYGCNYEAGISNSDDCYSVDFGDGNPLDEFINEAINEGLTPKQIVDEIWENKWYRKRFEYAGKNEKEQLKMYVFRKTQKIKSGMEPKGSGENYQGLLPFNESIKGDECPDCSKTMKDCVCEGDAAEWSSNPNRPKIKENFIDETNLDDDEYDGYCPDCGAEFIEDCICGLDIDN